MSDSAWADVKARLNARAEEFVMWIFPQANRCSVHELGVGSLDGMAGESLKIVTQGSKVGIWRDFSGADSGNNLLDLLIKSRGLKPEEALRMAADWCGMELPERVEKKKAGLGKLVKVYDYRDAEGRLVHQTLRYEPKKFVQRRPGAKGVMAGSHSSKCDREGNWWLWTLKGIEPVLYNLPELMNRRDEPVWITEGEKDADCLMLAGKLATTCPMGAGKWRDTYTKSLEGREIVLCVDSDEAGIGHLQLVGGKLAAAGCSVKSVDWNKMRVRIDGKIDAAKLFCSFPGAAKKAQEAGLYLGKDAS